jgi:hypothetical protein
MRQKGDKISFELFEYCEFENKWKFVSCKRYERETVHTFLNINDLIRSLLHNYLANEVEGFF